MSLWNVNSFHWEERPMTFWTKERIPQLFSEIEIPVDGGFRFCI
jgi:activator of HSP90 ATPase